MTSCRLQLILVVAVCFAGLGCAAARAADPPQGELLSDAISDRILSASQDWGELGIDTAVVANGQAGAKLRIKDKEYSHGLGYHANGEIVVDLDGQFKTFQSEVGIQWFGGNNPGSVVFQIFVDGKKVFDSGVMRENDAPRPVTVSVEGADELRLVVNDAGDGITGDCADWAGARLVRDPAAAKVRPEAAVDIVPFGQVVSWDPKVMVGTKAGRVEEFPAEDIALDKELLPSVDGTYVVPETNGQGCIGLQWLEKRLLRHVILQFPDAAAVPSAESVQLQHWTGESAWQGKWQPTNAAPEKIKNCLVWRPGYQDMPHGTQKVRWVFSGVRQPMVLKGISAYTLSRWRTVDVRIEPARPNSARKAEIEVYNGILLNPAQKSPYRCVWDGSKPLSLKVRSSVAQRYKMDRTVLRFQLPDTAFGVAVEDLLTNDCVYAPHADLFVTREPAPITLNAYLKKLAGQKTVLEQVRQKPDQDFVRAWSVIHNPIQDFGPMMISLACDNRKFIALREGGILFDEFERPDDPRVAFPASLYEMAFSLPWQCLPVFGNGKDLKITRHLQGGWLPIPVTTVAENPVVYRQTTYVAPMSAASAGSPSWFRDRAICKAEYKINNDSEEASSVKLALNFAHGKKKPFQLQDVKEGVLVVQGDRVLALIDTRKATELAVKRESDGVTLSGKLAGWGSAECAAIFPAWKVEPKDYALLLEGNASMAQVETYWKAMFAPAMQIEVPDVLLSNIIRASQVHCMMAARCADRGKRISAWASADRYGPLESESNSVIRGMDMNGQTDFARRSLEFFLKLCNKQGFITTGYTLVGTGEILWTLGEHYERTRDRAWMKKVAPDVARICHWVIRQREKTKRLDARGRKVHEYGLTPPGVTADWNRYDYRFFNEAQFYAGLEVAGRALADIGDPDAAAILKDAKQYREDIVRAFRWTQARSPVVPLHNGIWAPFGPTLLNSFGAAGDLIERGTILQGNPSLIWVYDTEVGAHHLGVNGVLDPASKEMDWIVDYLEDVEFLHEGLDDYAAEKSRADVFDFGGFEKSQPYYCRIAELHALRDDVKPFVRSYFNCIPTLVSQENLSFWEGFHNGGGWNKTHETGWFLCQTRVMFVGERGDELWLAPFVTNHWTKDGMKVSVRNAPTRFGSVSYTITSKVADGEIEAVVQLPEKCTAKKVVLRLRHPEGKPIRSVTVQGEPHKDFDPKKETVTLEPSGQSITIRAEY